MTKTALFAAGGTGGHIFPARATADVLSQRGWTVRLITDERGARHAGGFPGGNPIVIPASSPFQKNPVKLARALIQLAKGYGAASRIIKTDRSDVVIGFGGYPAFPVLAAARTHAIPFIIHEQNAVLGRVNRVFAGSAAHVASGFERLNKRSPKARHSVIGNPLRAHILAVADQPYEPPEPDGPIQLLIVGGSLGAKLLSLTVPRAIARLPDDLRARLRVVQQTRQEYLDEARALYEAAGVEADLSPFIEDMGDQYARAHFVISRAGASSVSEIAALGRPALFVPLAIAMDDHQSANVDSLVRAGAAQVLEEAGFDADAVSERLETALRDGEALRQRAKAARALAHADAHERLADLIAATAE